MKTFDDLKRETQRRGGILVTSLFALRDMDRAKRLGTAVVRSIAVGLDLNGMVHLPSNLPADKGDITVVVYVRDSPAGELIGAVASVLGGRSIREGAEKIQAVLAKPEGDALETVAKIRALVRDPDPPDETT